MAHGPPTLPRDAGAKGLPSPIWLQGNLRLLWSVSWRDSGIGQSTPKMHHCPFWDASRGALWSSAGALQVPHSHSEGGWSVQPPDARCDWERSWDPHLSREGPVTDIWVRGSYTPRGTFPGADMKTSATPWILPLMGKCLWPTSPKGCWLAYDHTPSIPTGSYLIWIHGVDGLPLHSYRWGAIPMSNPDCCTNKTTANPAWILRLIWLLFTDWGALSKPDAFYLTHEKLYCSQTPRKWPECVCLCLYWCK